MTDGSQGVWLVSNRASGSNDERTLAAIEDAFARGGYPILGRTRFPGDSAPEPAALDAAGARILAVFGGDGTVSSVLGACRGWGGAALVLPGGTKNLLSHRLHGDAGAVEIVARFVGGEARGVRPGVVRSRHGDALTEVLAGPGTVWNEVREAMREEDVLEFMTSTTEAIAWSANGPKVHCLEAVSCRSEGYAAITIKPEGRGLRVAGYFAETVGDYARHGVALLQHDFRNGPHDDLGCHETIRLACLNGEPMGLLIDGEPFDGEARETFRLAPGGLELLATANAR